MTSTLSSDLFFKSRIEGCILKSKDMFFRHIKPFLKKVGAGQTFVVLSFFYFIVGAPVAVLMKLFGQNTWKENCQSDSYWKDRKQKDQKIESYLKQY